MWHYSDSIHSCDKKYTTWTSARRRRCPAACVCVTAIQERFHTAHGALFRTRIFIQRSFVRLGSTLSAASVSTIGSVYTLSLVQVASLGSTLSMRHRARMDGCISVLGFATCGSSLSVRGCARTGHESVFDFLGLGSALSLRSTARFGLGLSVLFGCITRDRGL